MAAASRAAAVRARVLGPARPRRGGAVRSPCCPTARASSSSTAGVRSAGTPAGRRPAARQTERLFVGQMRAPVVLQPDGDADVVGIRFRPHGAFALLECPQHLFADEIPDVDALGLPWLDRRPRAAPRRRRRAQAALRPLEEALLGGGSHGAPAGSTRAWRRWWT